jgi:hypothetical protein
VLHDRDIVCLSSILDELGRIRHRFSRWRTSAGGFRQEAANLHVFSPLVLPWPYWRVARRTNRALLLRAIRRWMRRMKFRHCSSRRPGVSRT